MTLVTLKFIPWPLSSTGPADIAVAQLSEYGPESFNTATSPELLKLGASFTGLTTILKI